MTLFRPALNPAWYKVGDEVEQWVCWSIRRRVRITRRLRINGEAGFEGYALDGPEVWSDVWGYDREIARVEKIY
jgi:hypothetical protein